MVNKMKQPHGFGRAIRSDDMCFIDGQFSDGLLNGYARFIYFNGKYYEYECINGEYEKQIIKN